MSARSSSTRRSRIATRASPRDFCDSPDNWIYLGEQARHASNAANAARGRRRDATTCSRWDVNVGLRARTGLASPAPARHQRPCASRRRGRGCRPRRPRCVDRAAARLCSSCLQHRSMPRQATVSGTPRSAQRRTRARTRVRRCARGDRRSSDRGRIRGPGNTREVWHRWNLTHLDLGLTET
jgi:hypothetical protein